MQKNNIYSLRSATPRKKTKKDKSENESANQIYSSYSKLEVKFMNDEFNPRR